MNLNLDLLEIIFCFTLEYFKENETNVVYSFHINKFVEIQNYCKKSTFKIAESLEFPYKKYVRKIMKSYPNGVIEIWLPQVAPFQLTRNQINKLQK